ncbi:hypothetical protein ACHAXR_009292, partial [Thalassiosira sp. AJA248-18]
GGGQGWLIGPGRKPLQHCKPTSQWITARRNPQGDGGDTLIMERGQATTNQDCGPTHATTSDPDEHDCCANPMDADNGVPEREPRQVRRARAREQSRENSRPEMSDDMGSGHQPLQVENGIADLEYVVNGVPVDYGEDWTKDQVEAAITRGPHISATTQESINMYQDKAGFAKIVLWDDIKFLKISPVAAVAQKNRRARSIILDLSFPVRVGQEIIQQAVNSSTPQTLHPAALNFLGSSMPRVLKFMAHAQGDYPIYFSKYDISDGFWRMVVAAGAGKSGEPTRLVVPNALQMGWKESPGYFFSASETARDVASELAGFNGTMHDLPKHMFEEDVQAAEQLRRS